MTAETCDCPHMSVFFYFIGMFHTKAAFTLWRDLIQELKKFLDSGLQVIGHTSARSQIPDPRSGSGFFWDLGSGIWTVMGSGTNLLWGVHLCNYLHAGLRSCASQVKSWGSALA